MIIPGFIHSHHVVKEICDIELHLKEGFAGLNPQLLLHTGQKARYSLRRNLIHVDMAMVNRLTLYFPDLSLDFLNAY